VSILRKKPNSRRKVDMNAMKEYFRNYQFFANFEKEYGELALVACLKCMQLAVFSQGDTIFKYGEMGALFYIVMHGEVGIKVPMQTSVTLQQLFEVSRR